MFLANLTSRPTEDDMAARFLREGAVDLNFQFLQIDFHGGEPLLMKRATFAAMCDREVKLMRL